MIDHIQNNQGETWMAPEELEYFRLLLVFKQWQAEDELKSVRKSLASLADSVDPDISSIAHHAGDMGTEVKNADMNYHLLKWLIRYIEQIDDALERIEEDTYGICEATGVPISRDRLESVPHTRYSIGAIELGLAEDL